MKHYWLNFLLMLIGQNYPTMRRKIILPEPRLLAAPLGLVRLWI
jgi:hypothetical protein